MAFQVGSKVRIGPNGVSEFRVIEVGYEGDPNRVLIKPVIDAGYECPYPVSWLRLIEDSVD